MKRTIIDTCALTSFVLVVALGASAISIHLTRESRIKENREWMEKVIKEQVNRQIILSMPQVTGPVHNGTNTKN
tara:strand:- start:525 stop:746 length:222 start_codon:yes stop_codon:yes gene_type:complete